MPTRKRLMNEKSDAFVILPGGYGTMDELLEMITWSQINIHSKPIALFNIRGYFDPILQWIDHAVREGFISNGNKDIPVAGNTVDEVMHLLQTYQAPSSRFVELEWTREKNSQFATLGKEDQR
ncbi:hypothetical protein IWQ61_001842 [Dispira simplex]|nr:hypothetical protein IWQ61_001842 [Dispira simplex]